MDRYRYLVIVVSAALFCAFTYLLYCRGIAVTKRVKAVLFLFRPGAGRDRASLDSCTGWVRHVGRFRTGEIYAFTLDTRLTRGEAEVLLTDGEKRLLCLTRQTPTGVIEMDGSGRYFLRWTFRSATGTCELSWRPYSAA